MRRQNALAHKAHRCKSLFHKNNTISISFGHSIEKNYVSGINFLVWLQSQYLDQNWFWAILKNHSSYLYRKEFSTTLELRIIRLIHALFGRASACRGQQTWISSSFIKPCKRGTPINFIVKKMFLDIAWRLIAGLHIILSFFKFPKFTRAPACIGSHIKIKSSYLHTFYMDQEGKEQ